MNMLGKLAALALVAAPAIAVPVIALSATTLAPLDLSDMKLWNWAGKWHASEWSNANSPIPWRYNHVVRQPDYSVNFLLDAAGAPELQAQKGIPAASRALWEVEATLPKLKDGLIVAPLWVYDPASKDEVDFEFAGRRGLDVTIHAYPGGVHRKTTTRLFAGTDFSGKRMRFGIQVDQTAGTIVMFVNGAAVKTWQKAQVGFFPTHPLKPFIEMWAANPANRGFVEWAGAWPGLAAGERLTMTVHGYGFKPLP